MCGLEQWFTVTNGVPTALSLVYLMLDPCYCEPQPALCRSTDRSAHPDSRILLELGQTKIENDERRLRTAAAFLPWRVYVEGALWPNKARCIQQHNPWYCQALPSINVITNCPREWLHCNTRKIGFDSIAAAYVCVTKFSIWFTWYLPSSLNQASFEYTHLVWAWRNIQMDKMDLALGD